MKKLQSEHAAWVQKRYPDQPPEVPAMGCLEEAGELVHAILKTEQIRIWGEDSRYKIADLRAKLVDAVGDCGIYACSLCNVCGWDFEGLLRGSSESFEEEASVQHLVIRLVAAAVDVASDPTYDDNLVRYLYRLKELAHRSGLDVESAIRVTWEKVRCRV